MSKLIKAMEKAQQERKEQTKSQEYIQISDPEEKNKGQQSPPQGKQTKEFNVTPSILEKNRIATYLKDPSIMDNYNLLRTQILQRTKEKSWNSIMITSAQSQEGKTVTAINLSLCMSRHSQQTCLLVDANFRNPCVCKYLDLQYNLGGIADFILEDVQIADLLLKPKDENLVLLPSNKQLPGSADLLSSPKMQNLILELKNRYPDRYVVFDCPNLLNIPDSLLFSAYVDAVILVVEAHKTSQDQIKQSLDLLKDKNILGVVLNKSS